MFLKSPLLILISSILLGLSVLAFPLNTINSDLSLSRHESTQFSADESSGSSLSSRDLKYPLLSSTLPSILPKQPSLPLYRRAPPTPEDLIPIPSVQDIEKQLDFAPNTALFWSGDQEAAAAYAKSHGLKTMDMAISGPTPWNTAWMREPTIKDEYWDRASTAMVNVIGGTVYVMLRGGKNDPITHPGTVWTRKEWPDLKVGKNSKVLKVIRVNPQGQEVGQIWPVDEGAYSKA